MVLGLLTALVLFRTPSVGSGKHLSSALPRQNLGIQAWGCFGGERVLRWVQKKHGLKGFLEVSTSRFLVFEVAEEFLLRPASKHTQGDVTESA